MKLFRYSAIFISISLSLTGCGGNSSSSATNANTVSLTGVVIVDGYVQGATVCLDKNNNLFCESSEPQAITNAQGQYKLNNITTSDSTSYPVIAAVPVEASQNAKPFTLTTPRGKHSVISPITTLINERALFRPLDTTEQLADYVRRALSFPKEVNLFVDYKAASTTDTQQRRLRNFGYPVANSIADNLDSLKTDYQPASYRNVFRLVVANMLHEYSRISGYISDTGVKSTNLYYLKDYQLTRYLPLINQLSSVKLNENQVFVTGTHTLSPIDFIYDDCAAHNLPTGCDVPYKNSLIYAKSSVSANNILWDEYSYSLATGNTVTVDTTRDYQPLELNPSGWMTIPESTTPINPSNTSYAFDVSNLSIADTLQYFSGQLSIFNNFHFQTQHFPEGSKFIFHNHQATNKQRYILSDSHDGNTQFDPILPNYAAAYPTIEKTAANTSDFPAFLDFFATHELIITTNATADVTNSNGQISSYSHIDNMTATFLPNGDVHLKRWVKEGDNMETVTTLDNGSWHVDRINDKGLLFITLPNGLSSSQYQLFYTVYNNQVVRGYSYIDNEDGEGFGMNETAFNAFKSAIILN